MVTEVMQLHIVVSVYLDGGKLGTSAGFDIKEASLWWGVLIIANCWGEGALNFLWPRMPLWNGSWKRPGYHSSCIRRGLITKGGSHSSHKDLWVSYLTHAQRRRRRDEHDENEKCQGISTVQPRCQGSFLNSWIHLFQLLVSLLLCWEVYNSYSQINDC